MNAVRVTSAGASLFANQAPILQNLDFSVVIDNPTPPILGLSLLLGGPSVKVRSDPGRNVEMYGKRVEVSRC